MVRYMEPVGAMEGIQFKYGGRVGNTRDSHRLIAKAVASEGDMQDHLVNALFHAYFEVNEDISSKEVLARIAAEVGLFKSQEKGMEFLGSDKMGSLVDKEVEYNQYRRGISGVPYFIIAGMVLGWYAFSNRADRIKVGGAQDVWCLCSDFRSTRPTREHRHPTRWRRLPTR